MQPLKVYVTRDNLALIRCSECNRQKTIEAGQFRDLTKTIMVKCSCGFAFPILLEKRKHYRKLVNFIGRYHTDDGSEASRPVVIEDISRTGIRFRTNTKNELPEGKTITLYFVLDDEDRSPIELQVKLVRVRGMDVGGVLSSSNIPKALAFYLLP